MTATQGESLALAQWAHLWLVAAEREEQRVRDVHEDTASELVLFIDALNNVRRSAVKVLGAQHAAVVAFDARVPNLGRVRNMVEHFDEYVTGTGRELAAQAVAPFKVVLASSADAAKAYVRLHHKVRGPETLTIETTTSLLAAADLVQEVLVAASISEVSEVVQRIQLQGPSAP